MTKRLLPLAATLALAVLSSGALHAQKTKFEFGPPLRSNIVFSYKYTEIVREVHESGLDEKSGEVLDSGSRTLIYYISERQHPLSNGRWKIEANIDSMRTEYVHGADTLRFNTQDVKPTVDFNDREILGPSSIVNRVAMVTLSPYGELLDLKSESFDFLREQVRDTAVDAVTRERVLSIITPEYISSVMLPWRSVVPFGQKVVFGDTLRRKIGLAVDRIPVRANAAVVLAGTPDKPVLNFSADIRSAARPKAAYTELLQPVNISDVKGRIDGGLTLEPDGVVHSAWTAAKATVLAVANGVPMTTTIWHETYTEQIGMIQLE